ncbi:MAG: hypothetical protein PF904_09170 [Kiritimatiellae bacterium]|jgi:hypothetical protein|nr:hypothetical protein [Kiritimatiellia bacterium]
MADWKNQLSGIISNKSRASRAQQENAVFEAFLDAVAIPALNIIADELTQKYGRETHVRRAPASATLNVRFEDNDEIIFQVMKHFVQSGILPRAEVRLSRGQKLIKHTGLFKEDPPKYPVSDISQDDVIQCFLKYYSLTMDKNLKSSGD